MMDEFLQSDPAADTSSTAKLITTPSERPFKTKRDLSFFLNGCCGLPSFPRLFANIVQLCRRQNRKNRLHWRKHSSVVFLLLPFFHCYGIQHTVKLVPSIIWFFRSTGHIPKMSFSKKRMHQQISSKIRCK